jgi:hypothetical protein
MVKKKLAIVMASSLALALAVSLIVPVATAPQPLAEAGPQSPRELSVLMLPADLSGESSLAGQSTGWPPGGPWWKPKPPWEPSANKWAVVIGIANYQGPPEKDDIPYDLCHPDEDAKEMTEALVTQYGFPAQNIKLLLNGQATARAIVSAIDWLAEREDADSTVVFFFSGHGFNVTDAEAWAAGVDFDIEWDGMDEGIVSSDWYGLTDGFLAYKFSAFESQKFALIFGSCNSGGMFDDDDDLQASGRVICAASMANETAFDYCGLGNTLFGYYFVDEGILDGKADVNGDGAVSMEEALAYAQWGMSEGPQTEPPFTSQPQIYDGFAGELVP